MVVDLISIFIFYPKNSYILRWTQDIGIFNLIFSSNMQLITQAINHNHHLSKLPYSLGAIPWLAFQMIWYPLFLPHLSKILILQIVSSECNLSLFLHCVLLIAFPDHWWHLYSRSHLNILEYRNDLFLFFVWHFAELNVMVDFFYCVKILNNFESPGKTKVVFLSITFS
jgi:hypothetical protein